MKDCSLKICMNCEKCNKIFFNKKGWWRPINDFSKSEFQEGIFSKTCFSIDKGQDYGPTENCVFNFEHTVLDNRKKFKLNTFEEFNELYESIKENNFYFFEEYKDCFYLNKNFKNVKVHLRINGFFTDDEIEKKAKKKTFYNFKNFLFRSEAYKTGNFNKILIDEEDMKFVKSYENIQKSQNNWLSKFSQNRLNGKEQSNCEKKHRIVFPVAGVTFEDRQTKIKELMEIFNSGKRMKVEFEPEPNNIYDKNAIKILVENGNKKEFIGYVPKTLNKDQDNESKIENFNNMIFNILENIERAETSWVGEKNGNYGIRVVCYEKQ